MIATEHLTFPIGYGLVARETAQLLGGYYTDDDELPYLDPTDFILAPDRSVFSATYSSSAIGRMSAADALAFIRFKKKQLTA